MSDPADVTSESAWRAAAGKPLEVLRGHREAAARYAAAPDAPVDTVRGGRVLRPGPARPHHPLPGAGVPPALPPAMQELVRDWESAHPGSRLEPVRLVTFGPTGSAPTGTADLPPDESLVALSISRTSVTAQQIDVDGVLLLARRTDTPA
ncbi:hypothetical protein [Cellulomonas sp. ICMP 17802]|uniref:hypothetical protein n=1 Tax=Cellulomonas sp. ICMP 17802 TaxID=3239199 RepID=UPI00351B8F72